MGKNARRPNGKRRAVRNNSSYHLSSRWSTFFGIPHCICSYFINWGCSQRTYCSYHRWLSSDPFPCPIHSTQFDGFHMLTLPGIIFTETKRWIPQQLVIMWLFDLLNYTFHEITLEQAMHRAHSCGRFDSVLGYLTIPAHRDAFINERNMFWIGFDE